MTLSRNQPQTGRRARNRLDPLAAVVAHDPLHLVTMAIEGLNKTFNTPAAGAPPLEKVINSLSRAGLAARAVARLSDIARPPYAEDPHLFKVLGQAGESLRRFADGTPPLDAELAYLKAALPVIKVNSGPLERRVIRLETLTESAAQLGAAVEETAKGLSGTPHMRNPEISRFVDSIADLGDARVALAAGAVPPPERPVIPAPPKRYEPTWDAEGPQRNSQEHLSPIPW